jgi:hypothetical protein
MTFFLPEDPQPTGLPPATMRPSPYFERLQAAARDEAIARDNNHRLERERAALEADLRRNLGPRAAPPSFNFTADQRTAQLQGMLDAVTKARDGAASEADARALRDLPATPEEFEAEVTRRLQRDQADAQAILAAAPRGASIGAEFFGRMFSNLTDPPQAASMLVGAGPGMSLGRTILLEGLANAGAEALTAPRQIAMADRLGNPEPDILGNVLVAGATGAVLGGALKGIGMAVDPALRGKEYLQEKFMGRGATKPEDVAALDHDRRVAEMERRMAGGEAVAPPTGGDFNEAAILRAIIGAESGGKANAANPNSSARGLGQFISSTWLATVRKHRPDLLEGRTTNEVLNLRNDPAISAEMTAAYMRDNRDMLVADGLPAGPGEIYLAHFMGPGGARAALRAPLNAPIGSLMSADAIAANRGIRYKGKSFAQFTAGDLRAWAQAKMASAYDPNAPRGIPDYSGYTSSRGYTETGQISTQAGTRINVRYEVVDASLLRRATGDLQPRDRSRTTSDDWIRATGASLDPAQLLPSPRASDGAPIVGPDDIIDSGNGRFAAIQYAAQNVPDRYAAYRSAIEAAGYQIPAGVKTPVLIARRLSEFDPAARARFNIEAQDSGVARMNATDIARASARQMTPDLLARLSIGQDIGAPANAAFARAALDSLPRSELGALIGADGALSREGRARIAEALFARAWKEPSLLARVTETDGGEVQGLMDALQAAAPDWAALVGEIEAGRVRPEADIAAYVTDALQALIRARDIMAKSELNMGAAVEEALTSVDMFEGAISPLTIALVKNKFWANGRAASAKVITDFLRRYAREARTGATTDSLLSVTPSEMLRAIDPEVFGQLPDQLGSPRPVALRSAPPEPALPAGAFKDGAASPEAEAADLLAYDDLRGVDAPEAAPDAAPGLFDAPAAEAAPDLRGEFGVFGDQLIAMPDGTQWKVSEILDDLDADERADFHINFCTSGGQA